MAEALRSRSTDSRQKRAPSVGPAPGALERDRASLWPGRGCRGGRVGPSWGGGWGVHRTALRGAVRERGDVVYLGIAFWAEVNGHVGSDPLRLLVMTRGSAVEWGSGDLGPARTSPGPSEV